MPETDNLYRDSRSDFSHALADLRSRCSSRFFQRGLCGLQVFVKIMQALRENACSGEHRHKIRVATPARHNMNVQMIGHARPCAFAYVDSDVESLRFRHLPQ